MGPSLLFLAIMLCLSTTIGAGEPAAPPEKAPTPPPESQPNDYADHLAGSWGGARAWMEARGLDLELIYSGEVFDNTAGGRQTRNAARYLGNIDLTADLDPAKMGGWQGGHFHFAFEEIHGQGVSQLVGAYQLVSSLEPAKENYIELREAWFRQEFFEDRLWFKLGKLDANADFAATVQGALFLNSSAGAFPTLIYPTFPDTGLGFELGGRPGVWADLRAGVFAGKSEVRSTFGGPDFASGAVGHVGYAEFQLHTESFLKEYPGTFRFGAWYHTGDFERLPRFTGDRPEHTTDNRGLYATFDQKLFQAEGGFALHALLNAGVAPADRNEARGYIGGGLVFAGTFASRPADNAGLFIAHTDFSPRLERTQQRMSETVLELTYTAEVRPYFHLQPDFQLYVHPGGKAHRDTARIAGLRAVLKF